MIKEFLDFINCNNLSDKSSKILVAVSGGVDSVVLAALLKEAGFNLSIAHCNFHLRGKESDADENFIKKLAQSWKIDCFTESFSTKNYATSHKMSTQMAARTLRYDWFEKIAKEKGFDVIATAHHLDDNIETALFNLTKGTGISGLRGMLPKRGNIIRPLLFAARKDIEQYAAQNKLAWREDSSNTTIKYSRNLIRHKVVPILREINPALETTFTQTRQRLLDTEEVLNRVAKQMAKDYVVTQGADVLMSIAGVKAGNAVLTEKLLKPYGYNYAQAQDVFDAICGAKAATGKIFMSDHYQLNVDREYLVISTRPPEITERWVRKDDDEVENEVIKLTAYISQDNRHMLTHPHEASLDFDRLKFPLKLRQWELGDKFQPLGMKGKKKLSDFMIDEKIPLNLKQRVCVLESGGDIAWVVGYRVDDRYKVRSNTKQIYNVVIAYHD